MQLQTWTNKKLKQYCKFILGYDVKIIYIPISITKATMIAFPRYNIIVRSLNKFPRCLVWHECGHLQSQTILNAVFNVLDILGMNKQLTAKEIKNDIEQCHYYHLEKKYCNTKEDKKEFNQFVKDESNAHLWGYEQAVKRNYPNIAQELIDVMDYMNFDQYDIYKEAKKIILKQITSTQT
jgi:hypothetical protein